MEQNEKRKAITNLVYLGHDPETSGGPNKLSPYFDSCQKTVGKAIERHIYDVREKREILYGYKRSIPNATAATAHFMRYDVEPHHIIKDHHYHVALDLVTEMFRPEVPIRPVHFTDLRWYPWNLSTNAERPFSTSKVLRSALKLAREMGYLENSKVSFGNLFNDVFVRSRTDIHKIKDGLCKTGNDKEDRLYAITVHQKPALTSIDEPDKVRSVFGVPKNHIFSECMFMWPLFNHYHKHGRSPMLWGYETLNGGWNKLNTEYYRKYRSYKPVFSTDWSEFDMRAYFTVIDDIRDRWKTYFNFEGGYIPTTLYPESKAQPERLTNLWDWSGMAIRDLKSVTPTGEIYQRSFAGIPSGNFTVQYLDSFYNAVMIMTTLSSLGFNVSKDHFLKVMGDDGLFGTEGCVRPEQESTFLEAFKTESKRRFNALLNSKKSGMTHGIQNAQVLSYTNDNGYPRRAKAPLLAQLYHPKSYNDTYEKLKARAIGIYYASAGLYPDVRNVCLDIFNFLHARGVKANRAGLKQLWDPHTYTLGGVNLDIFPSVTDVSCRLSRPSYRSSLVASNYWNDEHFLSEY